MNEEYDAAKDAAGCYGVAIDEKRKRGDDYYLPPHPVVPGRFYYESRHPEGARSYFYIFDRKAAPHEEHLGTVHDRDLAEFICATLNRRGGWR